MLEVKGFRTQRRQGEGITITERTTMTAGIIIGIIIIIMGLKIS
jgi:hypothetical protein